MKNHPTIVPKASVTAPPIAKTSGGGGGGGITRNNTRNTSNNASKASNNNTKGGVLFLSTSKTQVPQQQDALLSALGYQSSTKNGTTHDAMMKPSVWGTNTVVTKKEHNHSFHQKKEYDDDHDENHQKTHSTEINVVSKEEHEHDTFQPMQKKLLSNDHDYHNDHNKDDSSSHMESSGNVSNRSNGSITNQVEYMRQLAKSRAERKRMEEEHRILEQKERATARLMALERKHMTHGVTSTTVTTSSTTTSNTVATASATTLLKKNPRSIMISPIQEETITIDSASHVQPTVTGTTTTTTTTTSTTSQPLLNIPNYYENRKSSTSTGPRMLFDPKSGSMVAAPMSNASSSLSSNMKSSKSLQSNWNKKNNSLDVDRRTNSEKMTSSSSSSSPLGRMKRGINVGTVDKHRRTNARGNNKERKIPRTCGVLYTRDENGSYLSADGCDGDQGYGYHLFPGGRIRNAKAYEEYEKEYQLERNLMYNKSGHGRPSATPLNRSHFMRKPQFKSVGDSDETTFSSLLKGDEKLDLLTALDESPKLQATAAVWAPSQAVLDITAAKMKVQHPVINQESIHHIDDDEDDDISETGLHAINAMAIIDNEMHAEEKDGEEDGSKRHFGESPSVGLGLGFDPTKNMDSVIMSPTMDGEDAKELNISNLELSSQKRSDATASGPKSILGSSPWTNTTTATSTRTGNSAHPSMGSLSDWDFTSHHAKNAEKTNQESSTSFLSFGGLGGNQNTWGSTNSLSKGFHHGAGGS